MPFADSNRVGIRILEEATWGTTPVSGNTRELRLTSSSFAPTKDTVVSDEIRSDRMVSALEGLHIEGIATTIPMHLAILRSDAFRTSDYDTRMAVYTGEPFSQG